MSDVLSVAQSLPYFAYGSNLHAADWADWCKGKVLDCGALPPVSTAIACDYRLVFGKESIGRKGGVADIRPAKGHVVDGVLFALTPAQRAVLDQKEGFPDHYERVQITVQDQSGRKVQALTYRVTAAQARNHVDPHADYRTVIAQGLLSHGLSALTPWEAAGAGGETPSSVAGIFVYGTLLSGQSRSALLPVDAVRHPATVSGRIVDCGAYPALVRGTARKVHGEFVELRDIGHLIETLDRIEGYDPDRGDNLFERHLIALAGPDGARVRAWAYTLAGKGDGLPVIQSGDWGFHQGLARAPAAVFRQATPPAIGSTDWTLTELARLRRLAQTRPDILKEVCEMTYGSTAFWRGGEIVLAANGHTNEPYERADIVSTRYPAAFTGLFVLCETVFSQSRGDFRVAYSQMSGPIRAGAGSFADQASAALALAEALATELAGQSETKGAK